MAQSIRFDCLKILRTEVGINLEVKSVADPGGPGAPPPLFLDQSLIQLTATSKLNLISKPL